MAAAHTKQRQPGASMLTTEAAFRFLAALASVDDLARMEPADREHLLVDASQLVGGELLGGDAKRIERAWLALRDMHAKSRRVLRGLFSKGGTPSFTVQVKDPGKLQWFGPGPASLLVRSVPHSTDRAGALTNLLEFSLAALFYVEPFPIFVCQFCERFFVRGTDLRRLYCSRECARRAAERAVAARASMARGESAGPTVARTYEVPAEGAPLVAVAQDAERAGAPEKRRSSRKPGRTRRPRKEA